MTNQIARKVISVTVSDMENDALYVAMQNATIGGRSTKMKALIAEEVAKRSAFEALQTRMIDGLPTVQQSADIKHVVNLATSDAFARLAVALKLNVARYINPQFAEGGKSSEETSSLKAYKKALEIAETIWSGASTIENVVKVNTVCAYLVTRAGMETIDRHTVESFFSSRAFGEINSGSADFLDAMQEIDMLKARHMTGGKQTQTSQMIRTLVALKSGHDVRNGKSKDFALHADGLVIRALMRRFGQLREVDAVTQVIAE